MTSDEHQLGSRKKVRKSRSRGLRTKTGCITCRTRHLKCDEKRPECDNCLRKGKSCVYDTTVEQLSKTTHATSGSRADYQLRDTAEISGQRHEAHDHSNQGPNDDDRTGSTDQIGDQFGFDHYRSHENDTIDFTSPASAGTSSMNQPVGVATARWFEMLAEDANLAFVSTSTPQSDLPHIRPPTHRQELSSQDNAQVPATLHLEQPGSIIDHLRDSEDTGHGSPHLPNSPPWRATQPLILGDHEKHLFALFVSHISQWIDLFDPHRHFSAVVPRLALHNIGLMNAILGLSARYNSVAVDCPSEEKTRAKDEALKYYHESLHYVRIALQHNSYHTSHELLATTLIISALEMLDGSPQDWQRHLQGVFWIQRSQVIHGDSGGLTGAIWWAWLCQDIWAAFRAKRRVFTFWRPVKRFAELDPAQLAARAAFVLAQVINYCAKEDPDSDLATTILARIEQAGVLAKMLEDWKSCLTPEFYPLPCSETRQSPSFDSIWIYPPLYAVALQLHHASHLLLHLHKPGLGGFNARERLQLSLNEHINMICGIAVKLTDYGSSIISSMCLYIAGICTTGQQRKDEIVSLLQACRMRTGWPVKPLTDELMSSWQEAVSI